MEFPSHPASAPRTHSSPARGPRQSSHGQGSGLRHGRSSRDRRRLGRHDGRTYYFCSRHCVEKFRADPGPLPLTDPPGERSQRHRGRRRCREPCPRPERPTPARCTRRSSATGPGSCPICGMALEPMTVAADEEVDPELDDMSRRFWVCLVLTAPLLVLSMAEMVPGLSLPRLPRGPSRSSGFEFALATPVVLWGGWPFFERGWASLVSRNLNMFTLIALGTGTAFVFSVVAALFPGIFPDSFRDHAWRGSGLLRAGGGDHDARPAGPGARAAGAPADGQCDPGACSASRPRPRGGCATTVTRKTCRSSRSSRAIGCASGRARRCRSTASCSKVAARSTNR